MHKIAICDDEIVTCNTLEEYISNYATAHQIRVDVDVFYSGEALSKHLTDDSNYEILFLDIELPNISGVEVGNYIRNSLNNEILDIVYISSKKHYALKLFEMRPLDFLIKPISQKKIDKVMDILVKKSIIKSQKFTCSIEHVYHTFLLRDILYFKSDDKKIVIITMSGSTPSFYGKLSDIEPRLSASFVAIHKSYLINMEYVKSYSYEWVCMINNDILNISKARRKEIRSLLLKKLL